MKKVFIFSIAIMLTTLSFGQAKKPTQMVVPADNWCIANNYVDKINDQGTVKDVPNYKRALQNSSECYNVITKINTLMSAVSHLRTCLPF